MIALMAHELSVGFLLFQSKPRRSFLLLRDRERLDLPKGRIKRGEDELACAWRELEEETGIHRRHVALIERFRFETTYRPRKDAKKTVVLYAAEVEGPHPVVCTDHDDYAWVTWRPPHDYSEFPTIHGVLTAFDQFERRVAARKAS